MGQEGWRPFWRDGVYPSYLKPRLPPCPKTQNLVVKASLPVPQQSWSGEFKIKIQAKKKKKKVWRGEQPGSLLQAELWTPRTPRISCFETGIPILEETTWLPEQRWPPSPAQRASCKCPLQIRARQGDRRVVGSSPLLLRSFLNRIGTPTHPHLWSCPPQAPKTV